MRVEREVWRDCNLFILCEELELCGKSKRLSGLCLHRRCML